MPTGHLFVVHCTDPVIGAICVMFISYTATYTNGGILIVLQDTIIVYVNMI